MKISDMRDHVIALYPESKSWRQRVMHMPDDQVIAIYRSKIERGVEPRKTRDEKQLEFPF